MERKILQQLAQKSCELSSAGGADPEIVGWFSIVKVNSLEVVVVEAGDTHLTELILDNSSSM